ncbi:MAG: methionyl-tRNA formyltransferase [Syntrophus sp. (in: bacteria)]|nr:methionyl-tRNA formyltransferase [Syntrophus sp. (in: bacteria)]
MNIVFFGSSSFSVPPLQSVLPHTSCVVTKKAKPKGRGYQIEDNEVKRIAIEKGLPVIEIGSFKDETARQLEHYAPDLLVVASFGLIIPRWVLDMPSIGPINVHPSLLPRYRGPSPLQWAIWNGEKDTGVTLIKMNEKMDEGNILYQEKAEIYPEDNTSSLSERLAMRSGEILPGFIDNIRVNGMEEGLVQNHDDATYTPIITKEMGRIDWSLGALEITRQIKALVFWPTAYAHLEGLSLKIFEGEVYDPAISVEPGQVLAVIREGILVGTPNGTLLVKEIQLENKKRMNAYQFAQGYRGLAGKKLD